jgi:hypothetical protein
MVYNSVDLCYENLMLGKARIDAPGALHHIIVRGIERRKIFYDDKDRNNLMKLPAASCRVSKRKFAVVRLAFAQRRRLRRVSSLQQVADAP